MKAQEIVPDFNNCLVSYMQPSGCDTIFHELIHDYEYKTGCTLKLQLRYSECIGPGGVSDYFTIEVDGFSISEESTTCQDLLDSLYPGWRGGSTTLNEVKLRSMMLGIYTYLADVRMKIYDMYIITPEQKATVWACRTGYNSHLPNGYQNPFVRILEATCMRTCETRYFERTPGSATQHATITRRIFFGYKKCYNTCCIIQINYCWDTSINPPKWKRTMNRYSNSIDWGDTCPTDEPHLPLLEGCKIPRGIPISDIYYHNPGNCEPTCIPEHFNSEHVDFGN